MLLLFFIILPMMFAFLMLAIIIALAARIVKRQLAPYQPGLTPEQKQAASVEALGGLVGLVLGSLIILGRRK